MARVSLFYLQHFLSYGQWVNKRSKKKKRPSCQKYVKSIQVKKLILHIFSVCVYLAFWTTLFWMSSEHIKSLRSIQTEFLLRILFMLKWQNLFYQGKYFDESRKKILFHFINYVSSPGVVIFIIISKEFYIWIVCMALLHTRYNFPCNWNVRVLCKRSNFIGSYINLYVNGL